MGYLCPTLAAKDVGKTVEFYRDSLGFKAGDVLSDQEGNAVWADVSKDGMVLMFMQAKVLGLTGYETFGIGVNLYLNIDGDIDKYCEEVKSKGVAILAGPLDEPMGIRIFVIKDPNGYQLTFNRPIKK
jgi:uncharacterized glyoxalase superfamily protein PhnB